MIGESRFFCADLSRAVSESVFGTASTGDVWLLLEYPLAWERKAVEESALPASVKEFLRIIVKTKPRTRVLLIKSDRLRTRELTFYVVNTSETAPLIAKFGLRDYEQLTEFDITSIASGNVPSSGEIIQSPLFLVCTHGRRDKCCAKFGYPLFKSLYASNEGLVWQSSHLGGDRFAANLVCLPHGLFYAHVTEADGQKIMEEYTAGRVVLNKYRGRACYSHPVQAAEFFVRRETEITGIDDLRFVASQRVDKTTWRIRFVQRESKREYEIVVKTSISEFRTYITCASDEERPVQQFVMENLRADYAVL